MLLSETLSLKEVQGNRLAAVSGAGFEAVGMADSIQSDDFSMELARFSGKTRAAVKQVLTAKGLDKLVTLSNPLDINPSADDEAHGEIARILSEDAGVDAVVMSLDPMSPAMKTLETSSNKRFLMDAPDSILHRMIALGEETKIPVVAVVDGGRLYDPLRDALMAGGVPVFSVCDRAIAALSVYIQGRLRADAIRFNEGLTRKGPANA